MLEWLAAGIPLLPIAAAGVYRGRCGLRTAARRSLGSADVQTRLRCDRPLGGPADCRHWFASRCRRCPRRSAWAPGSPAAVTGSMAVSRWMRLSLSFAALIALLGLSVLRFSAHYMHRETGIPPVLPGHEPVYRRDVATRTQRERTAGLCRVGDRRRLFFSADCLCPRPRRRGRQCHPRIC